MAELRVVRFPAQNWRSLGKYAGTTNHGVRVDNTTAQMFIAGGGGTLTAQSGNVASNFSGASGDLTFGSSSIQPSLSGGVIRCTESLKMRQWRLTGGGSASISSNTLTPQESFHTCANNSGTTLKTISLAYINTVLPGSLASGVIISILPTAATPFVWDATGNIGKAGSAQNNRLLQFIWNYTRGKWYPSYT